MTKQNMIQMDTAPNAQIMIHKNMSQNNSPSTGQTRRERLAFRFRKPFGQTLAGTALKAGLTTAGMSIPVLGDLAENIEGGKSPPGRLDVGKLVTQFIRLVLFGILVWQFAKGNVSLAQLFAF